MVYQKRGYTTVKPKPIKNMGFKRPFIGKVTKHRNAGIPWKIDRYEKQAERDFAAYKGIKT